MDGSKSNEFWQNFVETCWERRATAFAQPLFIDEERVFAAMLAAREAEQHAEMTTFVDPYRISVDGAHVLDHETFELCLPTAEDEDLDGYFARLASLCDVDLGIQVAKVTRFCPEIWARVRAFLAPLFETVGVIPETIEVDLFLGKYEQTHFGVHRDADSTFTFGLRGEKQFRIWPFGFFTEEMAVEGWPAHIQDCYYQAHREQGEVFSVAPGQALYWPSSAWHVGESPEDWSVSLAVAATLKPDGYERIKALMSRYLPDPFQVVQVDAYPLPTQTSPPLAPYLVEALADIRRAMNDSFMDEQVQLAWLKQVSGKGLTVTPEPMAPAEPALTARVRLHERLVWQEFAGNRWAIAAAGFGDLFHLPDLGTRVPEILAFLNEGMPTSLTELHTRFGLAETPELSRLLCRLASWYALAPAED